jgi:hypothetical protein
MLCYYQFDIQDKKHTYISLSKLIYYDDDSSLEQFCNTFVEISIDRNGAILSIIIYPNEQEGEQSTEFSFFALMYTAGNYNLLSCPFLNMNGVFSSYIFKCNEGNDMMN